MKHKRYTKEQIEFIRQKAEEGLTYKKITESFNKKYKTNKTVSAIGVLMLRNNIRNGRDSRFKEGIIPWNTGTKGLTTANSGSFKKGETPRNKRPIGAERVNIEGYVEIKVKEPDVWKLKHRVLYEKYHNTKLDQTDAILFGDRDKMNMSKDNLIKITRAQLALLNKHGLIKDHADVTRSAINLVDLMLKLSELEKKGEKNN